MKIISRSIMVLAILALVAVAMASMKAGEQTVTGSFKVLAPITSGNLTIFPIVTSRSHDTSQFITLDEGLRSGEVVVTEHGVAQPLIRRPLPYPRPQGRAEVNQLMLVNNSERPLLLLAGEIVTGGKQDRVVGADRIVPAKSDPVDLSVFCVEPGRWTGTTEKFGAIAGPMAQPSVRRPAMAERDQKEVWSRVRSSQDNAAKALPSAAPVLGGSTSYATVMQNGAVERSVDQISKPIQQNYENAIRELRNLHSVGVIVAVNGHIIWADIFASSNLLQSYWPKLVRSYAAEAFTTNGDPGKATQANAQAFIDSLAGRHEVVETDPGIYRRSEISGDGYKVFSLTSLLPKTDYDVHIAKMTDEQKAVIQPFGQLMR